ncbi:probable disease resistance protein At4g27220 isoform X1 [Mangifera indica]|uniref:probable disease resistance protein At4g27220 isoform X1 n=1 Tax=Mangifera indica TaxID=29780 RepID=UPI001CF94891|nr:probable disease resistance protein At4g27220 isoform X1 [Mangifera indica]
MVDCACIATVLSPVLQVAGWLAAPIGRQFEYLFNYTTDFKNLETQVDELKKKREEVEHTIIAAERNMEEINQNVKEWQKDVEKTITEAERLIKEMCKRCAREHYRMVTEAERNMQEGEQELKDLHVDKTITEAEPLIPEKANNRRCFKGFCPNFIFHYKQSWKAFKLKRDGIDRLLQKEKELGPFSKPTNPPDRRFIPHEDYLTFESRNSLEKNVWDALNDENVYMIGVYGMGGLGKTTLVEELCRKAEKRFDDIVFVEVSESPDVKKIQTTIAKKLGLELKKENESDSESEMADKIYYRMKDKNILLILDNIWERLELDKTVGIPSRADRGKNKLLITTRNLDVLQKMDSAHNFEMGILNEEEAWTLFTKMAGKVIQKHDLHPLQKDVCKECGGLPLVISAIAKALTNKCYPSDWECALQDLKGLSEVKYTRFLEKEYMKIGLSYKYLSDELKKTFLISSLMENNTSISDLFKHVVCLNILGGVNLTMEGARKRLDKLVRDLKDACLLLDGFESGQFAMHDVIRDVAILFAHEEYHVFTTRNDVERDWKDRDKLKKCTKISLPGKSTIISQLWPNDLACPNLEYFYRTDMQNSSFEIPEDFFTVMPNLRVLNLVGLRQMSLPSSIHHLTNLQTLCLDYSNIGGVPIIGKLKKLKVLSLRNSYIKEFPTEVGQLTELRLLDLSDCYYLKVIAPHVISKLSNLEELYLKECLIQWKIEVLRELKLLSNLTSVELDIEDHKVLLEEFFTRKLIKYKISVGNWWYKHPTICEQECLRILKLIFNPTIHLEELCGIKNVELLCLAEYLDDEDEDEDEDDEDEDTLEHSKFHLQSNEITPLFNEKVILPDLKVLVLKNIISRKIWDSELPSSSFQNLKELILSRCTKIKFVFPYTITKNLQQLQYLKIKDCIDLEEIVATEEITEAAASFVFPEVTFLELKNLPKLATFYPGIHTLECPKLKKLVVKNCDKFKMLNSEANSLCLDHMVHFRDLEVLKLKNISFEKIWDNQLSTSSYQSLTHLALLECDKIKYVFPLSIAKSLQQLQYLELTSCKVLERIVAPEEGTEASVNFFFPQVSTMKLQYLPEFTDFYPEIHTSEWPKLKELVVKDCPKFKMFTSEANSLCLDQKVHFCDLKILELKNISFEKICDSQLSTSSYQNLTHLALFECDKIKYVFPLSIAKSLQQLQYLELTSCKVLERIVAPEEGTEAAVNFFFPQVSTVKLYNLPEFIGIHTSEWLKLKELMVKDCPKFKMFTSESNSLCLDQKVSFSGVAHTPNVCSQHDLTKAVVRTLNQGSNVISMDFHPQQQTILLVGTNVGDISLWEVGSLARLVHKSFKVWDISAASMPLQMALLNDAPISVNRSVWGPDGLMLGPKFM